MAQMISRRDWLNASCQAAAAVGVSTLAPLSARAQASGQSTPIGGNQCEGQAGPSVSLGPGVRVHYREDWLGKPWDNPETVLCIHGNLEIGEVWYGWVPRLGQQFRLLRPDLPGFGFSTALPISSGPLRTLQRSGEFSRAT